jgi:nicotinamidase-related amidase
MSYRGELPIPDFYRPKRAADWHYVPDQQALLDRAVEWRERYRLNPAAEDRPKVHLLLVDVQKDFCFPEGTLYVGGRSGRGAIEDSDRIARFIYRNLATISEITCTLDTHFPYQIFSPAFWLDPQGKPPAAHREVTVADVRSGALRPNPAMAEWLTGGDYDWLLRQVEYYCERLEEQGKYTLYLWPPHCLLGSAGHALVGVIHEARLFHSYARLSRGAIEVKGDLPLTEYYSVIGPEVLTRFDGLPMAEKNIDFIRILSQSDAVLIAGQAASHCVRSTIEDLLQHLEEYSARKVYILRDCMSAVAVRDPNDPDRFLFDFTPQAEAALRRFEEAGMHVVESSRPLSEWPDFPRE